MWTAAIVVFGAIGLFLFISTVANSIARQTIPQEVERRMKDRLAKAKITWELQRSKEFELAAQTKAEGWMALQEKHINLRVRMLTEEKCEAAMEIWKFKEASTIRQDAIARSGATLAGQTIENFVPFMNEFEYDTRDAKFLGAPVDMVIFDGMAAGDLKQIIICEIKTGKSRLSLRESQIKNAVNQGRVVWKEIRLNRGSAAKADLAA